MNDVTIQQLAKWFLAKESMTHKKLQKVCYYGVAWGWALMNRSVITNDKFEAWVHGPVAPRLYDEYKHYGWDDIPKTSETANLSNALSEMLEAVWITYGDKSGNELEALSHMETPWIVARKGLKASEPSHNRIKPAVMKSYYNSIKDADF